MPSLEELWASAQALWAFLNQEENAEILGWIFALLICGLVYQGERK